ncbi:hypothetical protein BS78_02G031700 [Paspalum vaginatum]|nr:hypothetical protein BS78_02G031700 [Paspalum vaginatum]KAJ1287709.1 hypothetical protein BS78_02G031700 [Paspalum vaginatum]
MTIWEAALTDCLSTRWRHLWKKVNSVTLDKHSFGMQAIENAIDHENSDLWNLEATRFVHKVNGVLRHHSGNGIKKFKVNFPLSATHASELDCWVAFAAASSAEHITFCLNGMGVTQQSEPYNFPLKEFADVRDRHLHVLSLSTCSLETAPANLSGFSYLEFLLLHSVSIVDAVFLYVVSSCHALRKLSLRNCDQLFHVRIYSSKLVKMEVLTCKSMIGININAEKLEKFSYMGHKVDIVYECAPVLRELHAHFMKRNECPLDCIGAFSALQKLILVFPSRLQVSCVLQHSGRFTVLKQMVLCLMTSWKKSILSVVYLLKAAPFVEILKLELYGNLKPLQRWEIKWPKDFTAEALSTISIGGFSGEQELVDLLLFLLGRSPVLKELRICTHPRRYKGNGRWERWKRNRSKDTRRRYYTRGVACTLLPPKVPPTVKLIISSLSHR